MEHVLHSPANERRQRDRRCRRVSLVLHERRSGFDRRAAGGRASSVLSLTGLLIGLRDRPRTLGALLAAANVLNLADYLFTLNVLRSGGGEANPLMAVLFAADPVYAGLFKFTAVLLVTLMIWRCRRFRRALEASLIIVGVFTVVFVYHVFGLLMYC
jgi:hypothetical protein